MKPRGGNRFDFCSRETARLCSPGDLTMIDPHPPQKIRDLLADTPCQLLDVREYPEFAAAHVHGAMLVPLGSLPAAARDLDKTRLTILLCKGGKRARKAADILHNAGFIRLSV